LLFRLSVPGRDDVLSSPVREGVPVDGSTSSYTIPAEPAIDPETDTPIIDNPTQDLERELERHLHVSQRS